MMDIRMIACPALFHHGKQRYLIWMKKRRPQGPPEQTFPLRLAAGGGELGRSGKEREPVRAGCSGAGGGRTRTASQAVLEAIIYYFGYSPQEDAEEGMVRRKGLEPPRLAALEPKSSVSTNSTTGARREA